ncbi:bifunctional folylpolyglutamate synthase/dihydrofolate synthase [Williamsoniiplasma lucivorax]|uniref:Folylpolyglutamate synthase n=1 Tax=Williamsoniiplasma lucivorax TaxID=209274 RepID=A0A2S5RER9_9MOLU|nr:Mur ligase family protein [Williamsoniiplasma lucivorax]PPE05826.1 folylpolyglutamate synthase [Williamsoniiplasma lucivorax]
MIKVDQELIPIRERFAQEYNLSKVLKKWNHPEKNIPTINVVGTNGKGSTSFLLSQNLKQKYSKVGLFISPAFIYHNERIQINNEMISDQDLRKYLAMIEEDIQEYKLTFFEIWTLIMILYFNDQKVDIAVVEAGIGGVKDSTNLMSDQLMTLLTSVSLDHTDVLGADVEHILKQKLGIVKPKTILIISIDNLKYKKTIDKILQVKDIKVIWAKKFVDPIYYQQGNKGLVFETLKILEIKNYDLTIIPFLGRYTELKSSPKWVIDGAHNLDGIAQLIQTTQKQNWQPIVLFGSSSHKNHQEILALLKQNFTKVFITNFDHLKSWDIGQINIANKVKDWKQFLIENNDKDILICGSLYFIPLVYEWFYNRG